MFYDLRRGNGARPFSPGTHTERLKDVNTSSLINFFFVGCPHPDTRSKTSQFDLPLSDGRIPMFFLQKKLEWKTFTSSQNVLVYIAACPSVCRVSPSNRLYAYLVCCAALNWHRVARGSLFETKSIFCTQRNPRKFLTDRTQPIIDTRQFKLDGCIVWNAHNTVFGSKR